ncbi:MAG: DUF167 domain-containing protein [Planctomycetaceae bacterium]|jgi:uncharacterized protein|nr:DUF167 domain-containing protein [Planctomycetaceae bacterium]MBV8554482.1 DUF167 domain-containing protein [Planctomycetaceae bacterium]MBV8677430.1 DUF167 domain-containing protein [Planctomycetaceae bacterium]
MIALTAHAQGTILAVRAQPGARKNAVLGEHAGAMRVAVSAAPERGKANAAIQDVLARALGVKASQVALISGAVARQKRFLVVGLAPDELRRRLDAALPGGG